MRMTSVNSCLSPYADRQFIISPLNLPFQSFRRLVRERYCYLLFLLTEKYKAIWLLCIEPDAVAQEGRLSANPYR